MTHATVHMPEPSERLTFTGERYTTGVPGDIQNEHYHRYLFALRLCQGRDVLDVASGEGYGAALLAEVAHSVVGVDIDEPTVAFAARAYRRDNLSFRLGSVVDLPIDDACVDAVISFETIEHITDHEAYLREVTRVLRPGGVFVVSTPDRRVYSEEPGYQNPFHLRELTREEFVALLHTAFPHVRMFEQQVIAGSVLAAVEDTAGEDAAVEDTGGTESFTTTDGRRFKHAPSLPRAPYLVAIASAERALLPAVSVLHGLWTDAAAVPAVTAPSPGTAGAAKEPAAPVTEIPEAQGSLPTAVETRRQLMEVDRERGFLRVMLTSARRLANQTRAAAAHAQAQAAHAQAQAAHAQAQAAQAQAQVASAQAEAAHAQAQVANAQAEVAYTRAAAEAEINALRRSTSWRVTRPLRGVRILADRVLR